MKPVPHLPGQPPAGVHAHVAGFRLVPADRRGVGRDDRLSGLPLRAVAGTALLHLQN